MPRRRSRTASSGSVPAGGGSSSVSAIDQPGRVAGQYAGHEQRQDRRDRQASGEQLRADREDDDEREPEQLLIHRRDGIAGICRASPARDAEPATTG